MHDLRVLLVPVLLAASAAAQSPDELVLPRTNPRGTIRQRVGVTDLEVTYNRPSAKGRRIFGGLVPYGQVWRTGSDEATTLTLSTPAKLNGSEVPAGTYEVFTIPDETEWTVIVHRHKSQWGAYSYDAANDIVRVRATPVRLESAAETFTVGFDDVASNSTTLSLSWERTRVPVTVQVDVRRTAVPRIEAAMKGAGKKPYFLAAMFYYENGLDIDRAVEWMSSALAESPGHIGMLHRQALILDRKGDRSGAIAAAQASLDGAARAPEPLREEYTRLNRALLERIEGPQR